MANQTTQVLLVKRPEAQATPDCFQLRTQPLAALEPGQIRVSVRYISVDAGTRTMLRGEGFHNQVGLGEMVLAGGVGEVLESRADGFAPGDAVRGPLGAQTIAALPADQVERVDVTGVPISAYLGVLGGSTGVTAWIGMRRLAQPEPGDVFVVSAAAGAVGSIAGQIAKKAGATVFGIAGGPRKAAYLTERLGFDAAIDYKNESVGERLRALAPKGVNVFFDNVGGPVLDAVLDNIAMHARVIICGAISQYDHMDQVVGPSLYLRLAERQSRMEGFAYFHFPESIAPALEELKQWLAEGSIVFDEAVLDGIERYPEALKFMFEGGNIGKLLVKAG